MASDSIERERTWLVRRLPETLPPGQPIAQGYLAQEGTVSVRVRRRAGRHVLTVKGGAGRRRTEVERDLSAEEFQALWALTGDRRVEKVRHEVAVPGATAELDVFGGGLQGLVLVEVEFDDDDAMATFEPPAWFGPEVSDDERYTNAALARHGLPDDHPSGLDER